MCMYCEKPKTEDEHFACDVCGEGMCDDCYDLDVEHDAHYNRPLDLCDDEREIELIIKACGGEPEYLCEKCLGKILANPFKDMEVSSILKFIDNKLPNGEEVYLFSSEEYPLEFDKNEWEEVEGNPILWKTCLMDDDGGINRETISEAFISDREAIMDFYKNINKE